MIKIVLCLITTDFYKEEKYILSSREDAISLPSIEIDNYKDLSNNIKKIAINQLFQDQRMAEQYLDPKFISINDQNISELYNDSGDVLYFLYGCICPKLLTQPQYYWKVFDIYDQNILTELRIINNVIEHTI
jgi:hypothetical protein